MTSSVPMKIGNMERFKEMRAARKADSRAWVEAKIKFLKRYI